MSKSAIPIGLPSLAPRLAWLSDRQIATSYVPVLGPRHFTSSREQIHETSSGASRVGEAPAVRLMASATKTVFPSLILTVI